MSYKYLNSRQILNNEALSHIGSAANTSLDVILSDINTALTGISTTFGMVSNNDSGGSVTILTGTSLFNPYLDILSPDVYTVQTGAQLVSVSSLIVGGTLVVNGTGIVRVL